MKEFNAQLYTVSVRTFVIPFYYGSGNVINYGSGSANVRNSITVPIPDSATAKSSYGSGSATMLP
jgi:small-conductance mechanosensitive channel